MKCTPHLRGLVGTDWGRGHKSVSIQFTYPWEQIAKEWAWFMNLWVQTAKTEGAVYKSESADMNSWQGRAVRVDSASPKEMLALHLLIPRVLLIHHIINCIYFIFLF